MHKLVALLGLVFSLNVLAADYLEGRDYTLLSNPVSVSDPKKIEVLELFSYHCPHCFHFEPLLETWKAKQSSDVDFKQMPAYWDPEMEPWVRGFYTAQVLGILDKTHMAAFNSFQIDKKQLNRALEWAELYSKYGVSVDKAVKTFNSFGVTNLLNQAKLRIRNYYHSTGTPELYIQGKYKIELNEDVKTQEDMLKVADFLVEQERKLIK